MRRLAVLLCTTLLCAACSEPPSKEMNRAQGAVDTAKAAGAEQYAPESFAAASAALKQSYDAVDQRDYRLALSQALDAFDRAQEAAKQAADGKAKARSDAETAINATSAALQRLEATVKEAGKANVPAATVAHARRVGSDTAATLQKARTSLRAGNYLEAADAVRSKPAEIAGLLKDLGAAIDARTSKRKR
jgi:cysteinyl-tRNA synthetase